MPRPIHHRYFFKSLAIPFIGLALVVGAVREQRELPFPLTQQDFGTGKNIQVDAFVVPFLRMLGYLSPEVATATGALAKARDLHILDEGEFAKPSVILTRGLFFRILCRSLREEEAYRNLDNLPLPSDLPSTGAEGRFGLRLLDKGILDPGDGTLRLEAPVAPEDILPILKRFFDPVARIEPPAPKTTRSKATPFAWQKLDDGSLWGPSPIFSAGQPKFTVTRELPLQGGSALRLDYTVDPKSWNLLCVSPKLENGVDLSPFDGLSFRIYNPEATAKAMSLEYDGGDGIKVRLRHAADRHQDYTWNAAGRIPPGPGWSEARFYFEGRMGNRAFPAATLRRDLKSLKKLNLKIQDERPSGQRSSYLVFDDLHFFNLDKTDARRGQNQAGAPASPAPDIREEIRALQDSLRKGDQSAAVKQVILGASRNPRSADLKRACGEIFPKLNADQARQLKTELYKLYDERIGEDQPGAFAIRDLYQDLVNLFPIRKAPFSTVLSTAAISSKYQFTEQDKLLETAEGVLAMGADTIKINMGDSTLLRADAPYENLVQRATQPSFRKFFAMPFRNFVLWTYAKMRKDADDSWWGKGEGNGEQMREEYRQVYDLTAHFLKTWNRSGKSFFLGVWESDFHLLGKYREPSAARTHGFISWMNIRQKAVDDATRDTPHEGVAVYHYAEVVRLHNALDGAPRVVNGVLPWVHADYVSYSSYESTGTDVFTLGLDYGRTVREGLDYIEAHAAPGETPGRRVFIGEYGFPLKGPNTPEQQRDRTRDLARISLEDRLPLLLYWNFYDNEGNAEKGTFAGYWMINHKGVKQPVYDLHENFHRKSKEWVSRFEAEHKRLPTAAEFSKAALPWLD